MKHKNNVILECIVKTSIINMGINDYLFQNYTLQVQVLFIQNEAFTQIFVSGREHYDMGTIYVKRQRPDQNSQTCTLRILEHDFD